MEDRDRPQKTLLTAREASARFNVSLRTIYFWYRTGSIKGINVNGKCLRLFSQSIKEFLRSKTRARSKEGPAGRKERARAGHAAARLTRRGRETAHHDPEQRETTSGRPGPGEDEGAERATEPTPIERRR